MKHFITLIVGCWMSICTIAQSQHIWVATGKTTSIVFPFPIIHVDRGSKSILAEQITEDSRILLIKAAEKNFEETNLTVATEDGLLFCFVIHYSEEPKELVIRMDRSSESSIESLSKGIMDNPRTMHGIKDRKWDIQAIVKGIYVSGETIFYQLQLVNDSPIDFNIDQLRFYIRDQKKFKRTAIQEIEINPVFSVGDNRKIPAFQKTVLVKALPKFTIPEAKYLAIEIMEKNGGRHLLLHVSNNKMIKGTRLPYN
jgi:conjugative transposon TraN protein